MAPKVKEISLDIRNLIVQHQKNGKSLREISEIVGYSKSSVQTVLRNYKNNNSITSKARSGRPPKITPRIKRHILNEIDKNPRKTAVDIAKEMENMSIVTVHPESVRSVLRSGGYHSRVPRKKPFINEVNKAKRLDFAKKHINNDENFWKNVVFSDESKFNLFGYDGKQKVWRKKNEELQSKNLIPTVKHGGGSVMVWGCMSAAGVGNLVFIEMTMDRYMYLNLLKNNLKDSVSKMGLSGSWVFQQDNDPKHTAAIVKEWLLYNVPKQLHSPPQSPDLNPIENLWDELDRRIRKTTIKNKQDLKNALVKEWSKISSETTSKLVYSMKRRLEAVLENKGGATKY